jgi:poly(A) polymerase
MKEPAPEKKLEIEGFSPRFSGITALDLYYRISTGSVKEIESPADIVELSSMFDPIEFPGEERIDALVPASNASGKNYAIRILDAAESGPGRTLWKPLVFFYIPEKRKFVDPAGMYPIIRKKEILSSAHVQMYPPPVESWWYFAADAALLAARYQWEIDASLLELPDFSRRPVSLGRTEQRLLLIRLLESAAPERGFQILMNTGFIKEHWPLLYSMKGVSQDKDFHPEGDVWNHTMEMFRHMKSPDSDIAMGILVHDCGKAYASRQNRNEFDRHAQIGSERAVVFLRGLGFSVEFIQRVKYLVGNHMLTAHIPDIPASSIREILDDQLFPKLLEVYRCDISSTYRDPEGYYRACEYFRKYKRHRKNPYRDALGRVGVEKPHLRARS